MRVTEDLFQYLDFESVKKMFLLLSVLLLVLIPVDGALVFFQGVKPAKTLVVQSTASVKLEPQDTYIAAIERSPLFGGSSSFGASALIQQTSLIELTKDYRLKGVVITDDPETIVEDAKTQKTLFIKKGGQLGDLTVKEIKEGFITLSYLGGEAKLEIQ